MSNFVLVHGAWQGGWVWRDVATQLRGAGLDVYTPTLTGLGERAHLRDPSVGLPVYTRDIVNTIETGELTQVILCGHSYSGMVVSSVAEMIPARLAALVYLDALATRGGWRTCCWRLPRHHDLSGIKQGSVCN